MNGDINIGTFIGNILAVGAASSVGTYVTLGDESSWRFWLALGICALGTFMGNHYAFISGKRASNAPR